VPSSGPRLTLFEQARVDEARARAAAVESSVRASARSSPIGRRPRDLLTVGASVLAVTGILYAFRAPEDVTGAAAERAAAAGAPAAIPTAASSRSVYGKSGGVRVRFAMPGEDVEYPVQLAGDPGALNYQWVRLADSTGVGAPLPIGNARLVAPQRPGFYQLALVRAGERRIVDGVTLGVLVPFAQKAGTSLNGYRIGIYLAERLGRAKAERPVGFVQIDKAVAELPITSHLRLSDFITHDGQTTWPRYAAVSPKLLDKIELVVNEVRQTRGTRLNLSLDVTSGYRTPIHNRAVEGAAGDSRHQYGDAADLAIDADGDGRYTALDSRIVAMAVEKVERTHPELVGGLGVYTSARHRTSYVHIDTRGRRARWQG
jgi:uncharacterized protein YcbK (DUF882 family)